VVGDKGKVLGAVAIAIGAGILAGLLLKTIFYPKSGDMVRPSKKEKRFRHM
jgi:hypothetical protein